MDWPENTNYEFDRFRLDPSKRLLLKEDGGSVPLMPKAFDTLLYLVINHGRVIGKDELMSQIWPDTIVEENNLNQNISILRRIFGEKRGQHRFIATIPGKGYQFVAAVRDIPRQAPEVGLAKTVDDETKTVSKPAVTRKTWVALVLISIFTLSIAGFFVWRNRPKTGSSGSTRTLAVLPFKPLVSENHDEILEMGMADTLISRLGRNNREMVIFPLSTVRRYAGVEQNPLRAGQELGADSVLDGTIQRWGDKIRINAHLIRVSDGSDLWSDKFDEQFSDIFVVQDAISQKVASALAWQLNENEAKNLQGHQTSNAPAYELYLRGRYYAFRITKPDNEKAISYFQKAVELDPNYALAYAGLADAYRIQAIAAFAKPRDACPLAKAFAEKALAIDASLSDAHTALGWVALLYDWDWEAAERELKLAIELAPNDAEAHRTYGHLLSNLGRHNEAMIEGEKARQLAPLTFIIATLDGYFLLYAGKTDEAIAVLTEAIETEPGFWPARTALGRVYVVQGRYDEAIAEFSRSESLAAGGSIEPTAQKGYALAVTGKKSEASATLTKLDEFGARNYTPAYFYALVYNGLGDKQRALHYLERSFDEREAQMIFIKVDTRWDNLRNEPRFRTMLEQMRLG